MKLIIKWMLVAIVVQLVAACSTTRPSSWPDNSRTHSPFIGYETR